MMCWGTFDGVNCTARGAQLLHSNQTAKGSAIRRHDTQTCSGRQWSSLTSRMPIECQEAIMAREKAVQLLHHRHHSWGLMTADVTAAVAADVAVARLRLPK